MDSHVKTYSKISRKVEIGYRNLMIVIKIKNVIQFLNDNCLFSYVSIY